MPVCVRKQKLNPPEEQKAMAALFMTLKSLREKEDLEDEGGCDSGAP